MKPPLRPNWTYLASTIEGVPICPYRPVTRVILDGTSYFANGWNQAWYADITAGKLFPLGSVAPTTFAVADDAGGSTFAAGTVLFYYLVFRNSARQEETCPQLTATVAGVSHTMVGTKDCAITWTPDTTGRWDYVRIYRRRQNSDDIVKVADVAMSAGAYKDVTADAGLSTLVQDAYVTRYRSTLPPVFKAMSAHLGRIVGITGTDSNLYFSQAVRPDGELVQTDFPTGNILAIEPDDGLGENVLVFSHYNTTVVVKRRGSYLVDGDLADSDGSLTIRRMYSGRGVLSARAWAHVHAAYVLWDEQGLYGWSPDAEPRVLGSNAGGLPASPLAPLWARVNRAAPDLAHLVLREEAGVVEAAGAFDHEPIATKAPIWNFRENRFDSIDDRTVCAQGTLEDSGGVEHECFLGDLGDLWEREQAYPQGVLAGGTRGTFLNAGSGLGVITALAPAWATDETTGPWAVPMQRRNYDGTLIEENRVFSNTADTMRVLYYSPTALATCQYIDVGTIAGVAEFAQSDFQTSDRKTIARLIVRYAVQSTVLGTSPYVSVYTSTDERAYTLRRSVDMTNADGWGLVPCWDRGFKWNVKFEAHRAADRFQVQAMTADLWMTRLRR